MLHIATTVLRHRAATAYDGPSPATSAPVAPRRSVSIAATPQAIDPEAAVSATGYGRGVDLISLIG